MMIMTDNLDVRVKNIDQTAAGDSQPIIVQKSNKMSNEVIMSYEVTV